MTSIGWIYAVGTFAQNGRNTQDQITLYDYGDHIGGGFYFATVDGVFRGVSAVVTYLLAGTICTGAVVTGQGTYTHYVHGQPVVEMGTYTLRVFQSPGSPGWWVQAELHRPDGTLLYATGPTWPTNVASPQKATLAVVRPYVR